MDWLDVRDLGSAPAEAEPLAPADAVRGAGADDLLAGLNEPQRQACTHEHGPLLILAGPGSGKTRVITTRIAWLVGQRGIRPSELIAITFTNKAAREMRERVERLLPGVKGLWISTFHAMCARILRRDIGVFEGYDRDFSIYDTSDRKLLLKRILKDLGYDLTRFRPAAVGGWISDAKNRAFAEAAEDDDEGMESEVLRRVSRRYEEEKRSANALDFDDLLLKTLELFERHPGVRDAYAARFRHVMVDEYQDTNRVQYLLTRHLAVGHGNLAVCGDPDQSIYAWRGADIRNILAFEEDFGEPVTVKLEQNYRSSGAILKAASAVIARNAARKAKELWTERDDGEALALVECGDENDEGREIAARVGAWVTAGGRFSDVAVFYRANFMQRALETALRLARVPYQVVGGVEFYARREVRDLISYLRLSVNRADDVAFRRVVNVPARGIGERSLERLTNLAAERGSSLADACGSDGVQAAIRGRARGGLAEFAALLERLIALKQAPAAVALDFVLGEIDRDRWMGELDDGSGVADREANVEELRSHAQEYDRLHPDGGLRGFLEDVALVSEVDGMEESTDRVVLMTLHAAKGLEFPFVAIAGVEEELLPHARALAEGPDPDRGLEEERRLFYVGMTRARERLLLTYAATRLHFGETHWRAPSRFLEEIPAELVEGAGPELAEETVLGAYDPPADQTAFHPGDRVQHDHFGVGRIEALSGSGVNARATVVFEHHGTKQLLLQYANLRRA